MLRKDKELSHLQESYKLKLLIYKTKIQVKNNSESKLIYKNTKNIKLEIKTKRLMTKVQLKMIKFQKIKIKFQIIIIMRMITF